MRFDTFKSRFDDELLQGLLGSSVLRLIRLIDPTLTRRESLSDLVIDLYTPAGLLLSNEFRPLLLQLLKPREAEQLATILGLRVDSGDLYDALGRARFVRGSEREKALFTFFALTPPPIKEAEQTPAIKESQPGYPLFEHQRRAARKLRTQLEENSRRVLLHMPTGSGKTRTAMHVIAEHLRDHEPTLVIWLAHSQELCEQAASEFEKAWRFLGNREIGVFRYWENRELDVHSIDDGFLVAGLAKTYQSATRDVQFITELGRKCSLVIIDEAHSAVAETYALVLNVLVVQRRSTALLGLTATPGRTWLDIAADEELARFFNRRKVSLEMPGYDNPIDFLVEEGYLARASFHPLLYEGGTDITEADIANLERSLDIPPSVLKKLADDEHRNLRIILEIEDLIERHNRIILFAATVDHSDLLAAVLRAKGYDARSVTSKSSSIERSRAIRRYKEPTDDVRILCNYGVLTTGFDAPQTSAAIIGRPTKSLVLYSQMVGRAIRGPKAGGNNTAEIVTVVDQQLPGFRGIADAFTHWEDVWE